MRPDLVLQSGHEFNAHERRIRKEAFNFIAKFGASGAGIFGRAQLLIHSFPSKIMHDGFGLSVEASANYCKVVPHWSVREELFHQRVAIGIGLGEDENSRGETIDAVHDQSALSLGLEFGGKQSQSGRRVGTFDGHGEKSSWLIENDDGIVFVENDENSRKSRAPLVFIRRQI